MVRLKNFEEAARAVDDMFTTAMQTAGGKTLCVTIAMSHLISRGVTIVVGGDGDDSGEESDDDGEDHGRRSDEEDLEEEDGNTELQVRFRFDGPIC